MSHKTYYQVLFRIMRSKFVVNGNSKSLKPFMFFAFHFLFCFNGALPVHHFPESHDVVKEQCCHIKYPAPYDLLQDFLADKMRRTASRIAFVFCTAVMVL